MKFVAIVLPVVLATTVGLTGCDRVKKPASAGISRNAMNSPDIENVSSVKLDLYTQAYYLLMNGPDSLWSSYHPFHHAGKAKITDDILLVSSGNLENGLELFKKGLAIRGTGMDDLDEAVRDTLLAGFKLQKDELGREAYFRKQDYRGNRLTKAKKSYPVIQADYETMFACMDKIEALLFKYRKTESEKRMVVYYEQKNWLGYYTEESLQNARDLLALFGNSDDSVKNTDLYSRSDEILLRLESSLASQRKAFEEVREKNTEHIGHYPAINRILTSYIGSYRDLRQHRATSDLTAMYKKYNDALVAYQRAIRFRN